MNKKLVWLIVSCLMVAALVLASCAPKVVEEKEAKVVTKEPEKKAEEVEVVAKPVGPQYGGRLTVIHHGISSASDPGSPDVADGYWRPLLWLSPVQERYIVGDFEKYGPRGTDEYPFREFALLPEQFAKGHLIESWEASREKITWHVRPGIQWQPGFTGIMDPRELTAEDVAADLIYFMDSKPGAAFREWGGDIYATDKYTVVIEFKKFDISWFFTIGYEDRAVCTPPELITAGADKWENQCGTGPFMLKEYVVGSHMKYVRNPSYWKTTIIDGVEYPLPFLDEMVWPIIPDMSTQIAALRTGKIDLMHDAPSIHWKSLRTEAPELLSATGVGNRGAVVFFKCTEPPFDNIEVRRAMMVGTDREAFSDMQGIGPLPVHWFTFDEGDPAYTPLEELPAETRLLYDYNPELAKQMLADAGYPNGFAMSYYTRPEAYLLDKASLLKDQWAKFGVDVGIEVVDEVTHMELLRKKTYIHSIEEDEGGYPVVALAHSRTEAHEFFNSPLWSNKHFDELVNKMLQETDLTERTRLMKEAGIIKLNEVAWLPLDPMASGVFWWPWVRNYYGERNVADFEIATILSHIWLDQDLKKEMGH